MELQMNITDAQLRALLAKMMPETITQHACGKYYWIGSANGFVLDTELLHLASLMEAGLTEGERVKYTDHLCSITPSEYDGFFSCAVATWQQRTTALAAVKGVAL